jgi:hypothetical protein
MGRQVSIEQRGGEKKAPGNPEALRFKDIGGLISYSK